MEDIKQLKEKIKHLKVLFVDDEIEIRNGTGIFLKKFFDDVTICSSGQEGLDHFKKNQDIKVVITDIIMPVINGIEMVKVIKKIKPEIFVVFVSASKSKETEAMKFCNRYIKKPLSYNDIIGILRQIKEIA